MTIYKKYDLQGVLPILSSPLETIFYVLHVFEFSFRFSLFFFFFVKNNIYSTKNIFIVFPFLIQWGKGARLRRGKTKQDFTSLTQ